MTSIGIFTYSTKPRGSVVHACYLAEALAARGHVVTLYALSKAGDRLYRELTCPVVYLKAEPAPSEPDQLIAQRIREIADGVARLRPAHDVYHAEDCLVASGLLSVRPVLGAGKLVRTLHHLEPFESRFLRECQRRSVLEADAVACVSQVSQRDVQRELGRLCPIIGNGVDLQRFAPDAGLELWAREHFGLRPDVPVVLSVGGVEPRKNSLRALEAMTSVMAQHPRLCWLIAGGASIWEHDQYRARFRARLAELPNQIRARIVELGPVTERELTGLYEISQVLLCPSVQEGFGLCVLEALAARTAVVVSDVEPFTEYLTPAAARFVAPDSPASIAEGVSALLADAALCARLAEAGRERASLFSWDNVAREHERLYRVLLATPLRSSTVVDEELAHA